MQRSRERILLGVLVAAVMVAAVPALAQLGWHARIFAGRAAFPLDLEWMEGGMLLHAQRIAQGKGIYVEPSLDFIPFLYTPLYSALLAALSFVAPLGYLMGRLVSILAFAGALTLIVAGCLRLSASAAQARWLPVLPSRGIFTIWFVRIHCCLRSKR
jgi:hypothetical protein